MHDNSIPTPRILQQRAQIMRAIRRFFDQQDFIEVDTPTRIPTPALEDYIDAPPSGTAYLRTSPELHMKRMLVAGNPRIYQIGSCFRDGERGQLHNPEFMMLEWYRTHSDYRQVLTDCQQLICHLTQELTLPNITFGTQTIDLSPPWPEITVQDAFLQNAGWDPTTDYNEDRFEKDLLEKVEPAMPKDRPCFLIDYPAPAAALAKLNPNNPLTAERWELYLGGIEICNAFSELTNPIEQRQRFEATANARAQRGAPSYPLDEPFLKALESGLPPSGGAALGIDRLIMLLTNQDSIDKVLPFCPPIGQPY